MNFSGSFSPLEIFFDASILPRANRHKDETSRVQEKILMLRRNWRTTCKKPDDPWELLRKRSFGKPEIQITCKVTIQTHSRYELL